MSHPIIVSDIETRTTTVFYIDAMERSHWGTLTPERIYSYSVGGEMVEHFAAPASWGTVELLHAMGLVVAGELVPAF